MSPMAELYYRRLLDVLWSHGPLPADERTLSRATRSGIKSWRRSAPEILPLIQQVDGLVDHPKLAKQRAEAVEIIEKRRKAGKARQAAHAGAHTKAHASTKTDPPPARARPDPDPYKDPPGSGLPVVDSRARARVREGGSLTDEERAEAERLQAELEQRREKDVVPLARHVSIAASAAQPGNPVTRAEEEKE